MSIHEEWATFDRLPVGVRTFLVGLVILIVGLVLDWFFHLFRQIGFSRGWYVEHLFENLATAAILGLIVHSMLKSRAIRIKRRFQEIGYLNHHIRNAISTIGLVESFGPWPEAEKQILISQACTRIQACLEKISRAEDLSGIDSHPQEA